ncbi:MAG: 50S ribosomal protein L10 [Methanobacteriota archaeon]
MVAPWKKNQVDEIAKKLSKAKVVGVVGIEGIPAKQMQRMRKNLKDQIEIQVARNNIIKHALSKAKVNEEIGNYLQGPSAVVITELSPFKLEKLLFQNKTSAPARAGSIAPVDIVIPKGDTPFAPGPIIGDLQAVGIKAKIEGGKIVVMRDSIVVQAGEAVSPGLAAVLTRFGLEPFEVGLNLFAALEDGVVYPGDVLHVDVEQTRQKIVTAYNNALNLSIYAGIVNSTTLPHIIRDSYVKAVNLAFNAHIITKETLEFMVSKANSEASALKTHIPEDAPEAKTEESKEEPEAKGEKTESKQEEPKPKEDKAEPKGEEPEPK